MNEPLSPRMKVYAYIRKSTEDNKDGTGNRQPNSIQYQKKLVKEIEKRNNLEIIEYFEDKKTGYKAFKRVRFDDMIHSFQQGCEAKGIVCSEHSRLARNFADGGMVLWLLQNGEIESIHTHDKIFTNSPSDQMLLAINIAMDKYSSDITSFRAKQAWNLRVSDDKQPPNQRLLGYRYEGPKGKKVWKIDPKIAPLILELFTEYATGNYNLAEITEYIALRGLVNPKTKTPYSRNNILLTLKKIEYTGIFEHNGEKIKGSYIPIIKDVDLFYKVQEILNTKGHPKIPNDNEYAYTGGLIKCAKCGGNMSGTIRKGLTYYRCTHRSEPCKSDVKARTSYLRESKVDELISKVLIDIQISEKKFNQLAGYVGEMFDDEKSLYISRLREFQTKLKYSETELADYTKNLSDLKKQNENSKDNSWRSEEEGYKLLIKNASSEGIMFRNVISSVENLIGELPGKMVNFLSDIKLVGKRFKYATPRNKRIIVETLCANFKWDGKNLLWNWKKPYFTLTNSDENVRILRGQDSNLGPTG